MVTDSLCKGPSTLLLVGLITVVVHPGIDADSSVILIESCSRLKEKEKVK